MKLFVLYGQRKERYPGEYAPEALTVIDEAGESDNPQYMQDEKSKAIATGEFESVVVVTLELNGGKIMEMLRPTTLSIRAEII
jgi:hypothetical protein